MTNSEHSASSGRIQLTTYDPAKTSGPVEPKIPICWKCVNAIVHIQTTLASEVFEATATDQTISATTLIGCREHSGIKNYEDARQLCPLLFNTSP